VNPTKISRSKTLRQIQTQMNRVVQRISQRMGINPNIISVRFRYNGDYHGDVCIGFNYVRNPFWSLGRRGRKLIGIDKGIFNPEDLGAPNLSNLPMRVRLQQPPAPFGKGEGDSSRISGSRFGLIPRPSDTVGR